MDKLVLCMREQSDSTTVDTSGKEDPGLPVSFSGSFSIMVKSTPWRLRFWRRRTGGNWSKGSTSSELSSLGEGLAAGRRDALGESADEPSGQSPQSSRCQLSALVHVLAMPFNCAARHHAESLAHSSSTSPPSPDGSTPNSPRTGPATSARPRVSCRVVLPFMSAKRAHVGSLVVPTMATIFFFFF